MQMVLLMSGKSDKPKSLKTGTMNSDNIRFHTLHFQFRKNLTTLIVVNNNEENIMEGLIGLTFSGELPFTSRFADNTLVVESPGAGRLTVVHHCIDSDVHRYDFEWLSYNLKKLEDVFSMSGSHWYGGAHIRQHEWPLNKIYMKLTPFVSGNSFKHSQFGGVQERYFLSSKGIALFVDPLVPLFVGIDGIYEKQLTLVSRYKYPFRNYSDKLLTMSYRLFHGKNLRNVHDFVSREMISKPINIPDEIMFHFPIWSTWAKFKKNVNQNVVLQFADRIVHHGYKASQIEIDDDWTPAYGDMEFDRTKFPDPLQMIKELEKKGFRVTLWIHPFSSPKSNAASHKYWVSSFLKGYTTWWNGFGKCLDVTNPAATEWFKGCLQFLMKKYGVTSFKFDAGEVYWLPSGFSTSKKLETPNDYSRLYAEMCYSIDTDVRAQEVRVGVHTQHIPVFIRMMDKDSCWGFHNGLKTIIPHALTFGVIGYPFVLPDMIGGNGYNGLPDRELYIRWMEVNALLPCMQISIPPWEYDAEVVEISRKMMNLHEKYAALMISLAKESTVTGAPIIRPLWWIAPEDETSQAIDSEFLLGDHVLIAPVLDHGQTSRSIYLPEGEWKCETTNNILEGGHWYESYPAKLEDLPHFTKVFIANKTEKKYSCLK